MSYAATVLADTPLAYYRFGEGSGVAMLDSSGSHRDGSYLNGAVPSAASLLGDPNSALTLDGADDYTSVGYAAWMAPAALSVEFWFKPASTSGVRFIVGRSDWATPYSNTYAWYFYQNGSTLLFGVMFGSTNVEISRTALVAGTTYHVVGTVDSVGAMILYVNGASVANTTRNQTPNNAPNIDLTFGACHQNRTNDRFQGVLDEVALYGAVLSPARIAAHYNVGITPVQAVAVALGGSGTVVPSSKQIQLGAVALGGSGALVPSVGNAVSAGVALGSEGTLTVDAVVVDSGITFSIVFAILDDQLEQAPGVLLVAVEEGWPGAEVAFLVDGDPVYTASLDSDGSLPPVSVPIPETVMAGEHALSVAPVDDATITTGMSATFTVAADPDPLPQNVGPDADPVEVPGAVLPTGVRRWVLQDLLPDGLGSWVMPANPVSADPFPFRRSLNATRTEHINGRFHITEPIGEVFTWSFAGRYADRATQDQLTAFRDLDRRFYLIDHRDRAWTVAFIGLDLVPRKRIAENDGSFNDETGDYTVRALVFGHDWKEPQ